MLASFVLAAVLTGVTAANGFVQNTIAIGLACAFFAAAILALATMTDEALGRLKRVIKPSICFLLIIPSLFMLAQTVPLSVARLANTAWSSASSALGFPIAGSITIDTGATLIALAQYCAAAATTIAVAGVTLDRRLAEVALYLLTATSAVVAVVQVLFVDLQATSFAAVGIILSCATGIGLHERLSPRRASAGTQRGVAIGLVAVALSACTFSLAIQADVTILFAAFFGAAIPLSIFVIRKYHFSAWGMAGFVAAGIVVLFAFLAFAQVKRDAGPADVGVSSPPLPVERMLSDARPLGSGAGTFERLLPIYRELGENSDARSATAAAVITVEMGRPFLWGMIVALIALAAVLVRASLLRGRDYAYAGAGGGICVAIVIIVFVSDDLLNLAASLFLSATVGLAWGQSRGSLEKTVRATQSRNAETSGGALGQEGLSPALKRLQVGLVFFGLVLTAQAAWILIPEQFIRHTEPLPAEPPKMQVKIEEKDRLRRGAEIAIVRGDLWARSAFAEAALLDGPNVPPVNDEVRTELTNALRYAPYQSRVWLTFAQLSEHYGWSGPEVSSLLKMAYYTGPNEVDLIPARLKVGLQQSMKASDPELQDMIGRDVGLILRRLPNLKPALVQAYASASPDGTALVQRLIGNIDPAFLGALRK
jgi:hypothetical protein